MFGSLFTRRSGSLIAVLSTTVTMALAAPGAWAGPGYQLDSSDPTISRKCSKPTYSDCMPRSMRSVCTLL